MKTVIIVFIISSWLILLCLINVMYEFLWSKKEELAPHKRRNNTFSEPIYGEDNIFFVETSCMLYDDGMTGITLNPRKACAVESAARSNPQAKIYVLYTCHVGRSDINRTSIYVQRALDYSNVHIWSLNLSNLLLGSPLELWPKTNELPSNMLKLERASDIIKFGVLWKYAGTYFDWDFIVMKSLGKMKNFASVKYSKSFSTGVLNLAPDILGSNVASKCLVHLHDYLYGAVSGHDKVEVLTRVLLKMCNKNFFSQLAPGCCQGFTILNASMFLSIPSLKWWIYFDENFKRKKTEDIRASLAVHIFGSKNQSLADKGNFSEPYSLLSKKYCPEVYLLTLQ